MKSDKSISELKYYFNRKIAVIAFTLECVLFSLQDKIKIMKIKSSLFIGLCMIVITLKVKKCC
jgi:amino acid permease